MKIPLFPLDVVLFPGSALPLHIFEDRYKEMIGECIENRTNFGIVRSQPEGLAVIGCTAQIVRVLRQYDDGHMDILCQGDSRFEIENLDNTRAFLEAEVGFFDDEGPDASRALREECAALHFETLALVGVEMQTTHLSLDRPIAFTLATSLPADLSFKQQLLSLHSDSERMECLRDFYLAVLPKLRTGDHIQKDSSQNGRVM
jgi:Lon protease-like protein